MTNFKKVGLLAMIVLFSMVIAVGCGGENNGGEVAVEADYPSKPITYLIAFDPGGQSDIEARRQQPFLEEILGTKIVIEYKVGGGGALCWADLAHAKPDGYTIAGFNVPHIILQPMARDDAGYTTEQINPVVLFQGTPIGLAVLKDSPYDTLEDFINAAKENPGRITVGGSGTWSGHHFAYLQLQKLSGAEMSYVPATGAAPSVQNFLGGHTEALLANSNDLVTYKDQIKVLALGTTERFESLPEAPTFVEQGYDMTPSIERGVAVPPNTPKEIIQKLEDAFLEIMKDEEIRENMIQQGFVPLSMGAEESQEYINQRKIEYETLVKEFDLL